MQLWPVEHFWLTFFSRSALIWKKSDPKVFNWSELHLSEVTSYKIHILVRRYIRDKVKEAIDKILRMKDGFTWI